MPWKKKYLTLITSFNNVKKQAVAHFHIFLFWHSVLSHNTDSFTFSSTSIVSTKNIHNKNSISQKKNQKFITKILETLRMLFNYLQKKESLFPRLFPHFTVQNFSFVSRIILTRLPSRKLRLSPRKIYTTKIRLLKRETKNLLQKYLTR